jgi:dodecin
MLNLQMLCNGNLVHTSRCFQQLTLLASENVPYVMTHVAKIIEIVGSSDESWQDAAQAALNESKKTVHGITGIEVGDMTAKVDPNNGAITQYHTTVKIAFGVEH